MERQNERSLRNCLRKYKEKEKRRKEKMGSKGNFRYISAIQQVI